MNIKASFSLSPDVALAAALVAGASQSRGCRVTVLYTVVQIANNGNVVDPGERPVGSTTQYPLMPVAMRFCSGHDLGQQPHVDLRRLNTIMTPEMVDKLQPILRDGLQPGGIVAGDRERGRAAIHTTPTPPQIIPWDGNRRFKQLYHPGIFQCYVISIRPDGLVTGDARINQQGFILQN